MQRKILVHYLTKQLIHVMDPNWILNYQFKANAKYMYF